MLAMVTTRLLSIFRDVATAIRIESFVLRLGFFLTIAAADDFCEILGINESYLSPFILRVLRYKPNCDPSTDALEPTLYKIKTVVESLSLVELLYFRRAKD